MKKINFNFNYRIIIKFSLLLLLISISAVYIISTMVVWNLSHPSRERVYYNIRKDFTEAEDIGFYSRKNDVFLKGWLIKAPDNKKTVIFAHGYGKNRLQDDVPLIDLVTELHKQGINVVMFDMRNSGESQKALTTIGYNEAYDLLGAYDYILNRNDVNNDVVLHGFSMGAVATILAAEKEPRVKKIIADSPFADLKMYMEDKLSIWSNLPPFPFNFTCIQMTPLISELSIEEVSPLHKVKNLKNTKMLLIHGLNDNDIDVKNSEIIADNYSDAKLITFPKAEHVKSYSVDKDKYVKNITEFILQE